MNEKDERGTICRCPAFIIQHSYFIIQHSYFIIS